MIVTDLDELICKSGLFAITPESYNNGNFHIQQNKQTMKAFLNKEQLQWKTNSLLQVLDLNLDSFGAAGKVSGVFIENCGVGCFIPSLSHFN